MKKKIFDCLILEKRSTGVGRAIIQILNGIKGRRDYYVLANKHFPLNKDDFNLIILPYAHLDMIRMIYQLFLMPLILLYLRAKWYIAPTYIVPIVKVCRIAVFMHDIMLYRVRKKYPFVKFVLYHFTYLICLFNADIILVSSKSAKGDIENFTRKKVFCIYWKMPEITKNEKPIEYLKNEKFLFMVSSIEAGKNIDFLIRAYAKLPEKVKNEYKLVISGKNINVIKKLDRIINEHTLSGNVIMTGYVTDEELVWLYRHASLFVFPSIYEGFGFPVLEAIYYDIPVICSDSSSLKEILNDKRFRFGINDEKKCCEMIVGMLDRSDIYEQYRKWYSDFKRSNPFF